MNHICKHICFSSYVSPLSNFVLWERKNIYGFPLSMFYHICKNISFSHFQILFLERKSTHVFSLTRSYHIYKHIYILFFSSSFKLFNMREKKHTCFFSHNCSSYMKTYMSFLSQILLWERKTYMFRFSQILIRYSNIYAFLSCKFLL